MRRTRLLATSLVGAALLVAACAVDDGPEAASTSIPSETPPPTTRPAGPAPSAGCDATAVLPPGTADDTMQAGGQERHYQLVLPADYDGREPLPLVFALHALTVPYGVTPSIDGLLDEAATRAFVIVAPSGLLDAGTPYWLAAPIEPNYDVDFLGALLDRLEADVCFDTSLVFSTGQSNGAQMSSLLACRMDDRITAVAPVDGVEFNDETCTGDPVPVMAFHGDADAVVTYEGGGLNATAIANQQYWKGDVPAGLPVHGGVDQAMAEWAAHNGCAPEPVEDRISPEVIRRTWQDCEAETVLYVVEGGGHTWPGRPLPGNQFGPTTTDIDATSLIFDFWLGPA